MVSIASRFTHSSDRVVKIRKKETSRLGIQDLLKLIGVGSVGSGLALGVRTTAVVGGAALATGVGAGLPLFSDEGFFQHLPYLTKPGQTGIINTLGRAFADNRLMTLFIITLPAIGLSERYGLQEQAANLIRKIHAATVGRLQIVYQLFRVLHGLMGIRLNGHPSFVRPFIFPMSVGAAQATNIAPRSDASGPIKTEERLAPAPNTAPQSVTGVTPKTGGSIAPARGADPIEKIKASNAAAENYGNFYGQNLS